MWIYMLIAYLAVSSAFVTGSVDDADDAKTKRQINQQHANHQPQYHTTRQFYGTTSAGQFLGADSGNVKEHHPQQRQHFGEVPSHQKHQQHDQNNQEIPPEYYNLFQELVLQQQREQQATAAAAQPQKLATAGQPGHHQHQHHQFGGPTLAPTIIASQTQSPHQYAPLPSDSNHLQHHPGGQYQDKRQQRPHIQPQYTQHAPNHSENEQQVISEEEYLELVRAQQQHQQQQQQQKSQQGHRFALNASPNSVQQQKPAGLGLGSYKEPTSSPTSAPINYQQQPQFHYISQQASLHKQQRPLADSSLEKELEKLLSTNKASVQSLSQGQIYRPTPASRPQSQHLKPQRPQGPAQVHYQQPQQQPSGHPQQQHQQHQQRPQYTPLTEEEYTQLTQEQLSSRPISAALTLARPAPHNKQPPPHYQQYYQNGGDSNHGQYLTETTQKYNPQQSFESSPSRPQFYSTDREFSAHAPQRSSTTHTLDDRTHPMKIVEAPQLGQYDKQQSHTAQQTIKQQQQGHEQSKDLYQKYHQEASPSDAPRSSIFVSHTSSQPAVKDEKVQTVRLPPPNNGRPLTEEEFQALVDAGYSVEAVHVPVPVPAEKYYRDRAAEAQNRSKVAPSSKASIPAARYQQQATATSPPRHQQQEQQPDFPSYYQPHSGAERQYSSAGRPVRKST